MRRLWAMLAAGLCACAFILALGESARAHPAEEHVAAAGPHASLVGHPIELTGVIDVVHGDGFDADASFIKHLLRAAEGEFELELQPGVPSPSPGQSVSVSGELVGDTLIAASIVPLHGALAAPVAQMNAGLAAGQLNVAVILVNFADDPSQPFSVAEVDSAMFSAPDSVAAFYAEQSFGQLTVAGSVFGWHTLAHPSATCDYSAWGDAAKAAVGQPTLASFTNVMLVFPSTPACGWLGLADIEGPRSFINGDISLYVLAHEFGHNVGLGHASTLSCTDGVSPVALSDSCSIANSYGDEFSVMGSGSSAHFNGVHKLQAGWVAANVVTVTASGTYTLAPLGAPSPSPQVLRVKRRDDTLIVDFRQPVSAFETFPVESTASEGVLLRLTDESEWAWTSELIDATPETPTFLDAALLPGETFFDPASGIQITMVSVSPEGATVQVAPGAFVDTAPPAAPLGLDAVLEAGGRATLSWTPAVDESGIDHYVVYRENAELASAGEPLYADQLDPTVPGPVSYEVAAVDRAGNVGPRSAAFTLIVPDVTAPTAPASPEVVVTVEGRRAVARLRWEKSQDDVGVRRYLVIHNGKVVGRPRSPRSGERIRPGKRHVYKVVAVDSSGNRSPASARVVLRLPRNFITRARRATVRGLRARFRADGRIALAWRRPADGTSARRYVVLSGNRRVLRTRATRASVRLRPSADAVIRVRSLNAASTGGRAATILVARS